MRAYVSTATATCGVGVVYGMGATYATDLTKYKIEDFGGGIGYNIAGFVNTKVCRKTYNWIKDNYDIVFQSPVKRNRNSGHLFFFIVFKER